MNFVARACGIVLLALTTGVVVSGAVRDLRLIDAVRNGDVATVRRLLALKVDVNQTQPDGATALHWAVERDRLDITEALLKSGAKPDVTNDYGVTPLMLAAANGSAPMIDRLVAGGASPNAALPTGETVLMTAARTGRLDAVRTLLQRGANVNAREQVKGQTALMWAIWQGHDDVARTLVEAGADVKAASDTGFTPLLFAVREGRLDMARLLLDRGASVGEAGKDGNSALHVAVVRGHVEVATFLLDRGADPNAAASGFTPLHWAAGTWESGHSHDYIFNEIAVNTVREWSVLAGIPTMEAKHALIAALVAHGAEVNARMQKAPPRFGHSLFKGDILPGATPFYLAAITADVPTMKLLLQHGADPKIGAGRGVTPLIVAAGVNHVEQESRVPEARMIEAIALLLEIGADINQANNAGDTALHAATRAGLDKVVPYLVQRGANINARNKAGATPLKLARGFEDMFLLYMRPSTAKILEQLGGTE